MTDVTRILSAIEQGDPHAAEQLLPLVYDELRKLAAQKLAQEKPGQTLQATALVHEAYLRLVDVEQARHWNSRGHFFAAAAEAMRRILIDHARGMGSRKNGGGLAGLCPKPPFASWTFGRMKLLHWDEAGLLGQAEPPRFAKTKTVRRDWRPFAAWQFMGVRVDEQQSRPGPCAINGINRGEVSTFLPGGPASCWPAARGASGSRPSTSRTSGAGRDGRHAGRDARFLATLKALTLIRATVPQGLTPVNSLRLH